MIAREYCQFGSLNSPDVTAIQVKQARSSKDPFVSQSTLREFHKLFTFVSLLHKEAGLCLLNISPRKVLASSMDKVSNLPENVKLYDLTRASTCHECVERDDL